MEESQEEKDLVKERIKSFRNSTRRLTVAWDTILGPDDVDADDMRLRGDSEVKIHQGLIQIPKTRRNFCTGSSYTGKWDALGMAGYGTYVFPHNVIYKGNFKDGTFHGKGTLIYPNGQQIVGRWKRGALVSSEFRFGDGLYYSTPWKYCKMPDRRFHIERERDMRSAPDEFLTNSQPTRKIPDDCYDTGDGFFNAKTKCLTPINAQNEPDGVLFNVPTPDLEHRILKGYRRAAIGHVGFVPQYFEHLSTGRDEEVKNLAEEMDFNTLSDIVDM